MIVNLSVAARVAVVGLLVAPGAVAAQQGNRGKFPGGQA